jgi:hypothetical protein
MNASETIPAGPFLSALRLNDSRYQEEQATRVAAQELLIECAEQGMRTVHIAIASVLGRPGGLERDRARIASTLLLRAADDLDGFVTLALGGYPLQAATLGSSLWEKVHCANLVATSDDDARKWLAGAIDLSAEHPFYRSKKYRRGFEELAKRIDAPITFDQTLEHYSSLCRAKHAHPWIMQHFGVRRNGEAESELVYGPTGSSGWRLVVGEFAPAVLATLFWGVLGYANANEDLLDKEDPSLGVAFTRCIELRKSLSSQIDSEFRTEGREPGGVPSPANSDNS